MLERALAYIYESVGAPYPRASLIAGIVIFALVGAAIFFILWGIAKNSYNAAVGQTPHVMTQKSTSSQEGTTPSGGIVFVGGKDIQTEGNTVNRAKRGIVFVDSDNVSVKDNKITNITPKQ